jgi:N-acetyl-alpha-D-muramate 1-phosphate uridylyltransferase
MRPRVAMILAAGRGERMRPLTDTLPKPLAPLHGKPLVVHTIERLAAANIERVVLNLAWRGQQIRETLQDGRRWGIEILYSDEGDRVLGTGGGIVQALPLLGDDPFWVVSGDLWTDYPFAQRVHSLAANDLAHLVMVPNPEFHPNGDFYLQNKRVTTTFSLAAQRLTFGSIGCFHPEFFRGRTLAVASIAPWLQQAMSYDRISGERYEGEWFNIGTMAQLESLEALLSSQIS